jgi:hypothetical protein
MITSVFRKSTPINYLFVLVAIIFFYGLYQFKHGIVEYSLFGIGEKVLVFLLLLGSFFFTNFIIKKNGLSKDSTFTVFILLLLFLFFPSVFDNSKLILSNFLVLLGLRRLISIQTLKAPKEKIFDAALCFFVASIFHFWAILFVILVFLAILFHVSRDYRHWILPFLALFTVAVIYILASLNLNPNWIKTLHESATISFNIDYFQNVYQNIALSIYAAVILFFVVSFLTTLSSRPLILQSSFQIILVALAIGIAIFVLSPNKSNDLLIYTFAPLAMIATFHMEWSQIKWQNEAVLYTLLALGLFTYFSQL